MHLREHKIKLKNNVWAMGNITEFRQLLEKKSFIILDELDTQTLLSPEKSLYVFTMFC
jgi:hypothetical protein